MFKRRIPQNYEFEMRAIADAVQTVLPGVRVDVNDRGVILIYANPTPAQLTALRAAILPLLTDVQDITV